MKKTQPTLFEDNLDMHFEQVDISTIMPGQKKKLIGSVSRVGVLQTILLVPLPDTHAFRYEIVDGEGRHYSAVQAKLTHIPALIVEGVTKEQAMAMRTITNIDRGPNIVAEARAIKRVMDSGRYGNLSEASADLEVGVGTLKKRLKLTSLPEDMLEAVYSNKISPGVLQQVANLSAAYQARAIALFRETVATEKGTFTAAHLKEIQVRKQGDLSSSVMAVLHDIPAALPLISLTPVQLLAEDIRRRCADRNVALEDLVAELMGTALDNPPAAQQNAGPDRNTVQINPERDSVNPGIDEAQDREEEERDVPATSTPEVVPAPAAPPTDGATRPSRVNKQDAEEPLPRRRTNISVDR